MISIPRRVKTAPAIEALETRTLLSQGVTFTSTDVPKWYYSDNVAVYSYLDIPEEENLQINDLDVHLDITQPWDIDLTITLVSPRGTQIVLWNGLSHYPNSCGSNFSGTTFDDEAANPIGAGFPPYTGSYKPDRPLSKVDGSNASGRWQLKMQDFIWYGIDYLGGRLNSWSLTINGSQSLSPTISINDVAVPEGNSGTRDATFNVNPSSPSSQTVTVAYATANGSATHGSDYTATSGTLTFPPGVTSLPITVKVSGDTTDEPDETFYVDLSNPSNATIADNQGVGTILNDDTAELPVLSINDVALQEGNTRQGTTFSFIVSLSKPSTQRVTVNYNNAYLQTDTANPYTDYMPVSGTLRFNPGQTTKTIAVKVIGDTVFENDETFSVVLFSPTNATIVKALGTGTILNDDPPPPMIAGSEAVPAPMSSKATAAAQLLGQNVGFQAAPILHRASVDGLLTSGGIDLLASVENDLLGWSWPWRRGGPLRHE